FQAYKEAKLRLEKMLQKDGKLFIHESIVKEGAFRYGLSESSHVRADGEYIFYFGDKEAELPSSLKRNFSHDTENFLAAYAIARTQGVSPEICVEAFSSFKKPPHRIEFVKNVGGISYYDD